MRQLNHGKQSSRTSPHVYSMAGVKRSRVFRGFPVPFRMRWGRAGRGRPGGNRRPDQVEEAARQSCARQDEGRSDPVRL